MIIFTETDRVAEQSLIFSYDISELGWVKHKTRARLEMPCMYYGRAGYNKNRFCSIRSIPRTPIAKTSLKK